MSKKLTVKEQALKNFMQEKFDFATLKKVGFFPKGMKCNDYEGQAKRVCDRLGYKSIYEYGRKEIRCHLTYVDDRPLHINKSGELKEEPFITVIHPNQLHI